MLVRVCMIHVRPRRSHRHRARARHDGCGGGGGGDGGCRPVPSCRVPAAPAPPAAPGTALLLRHPAADPAGAGARVARSVGERGGRCACAVLRASGSARRRGGRRGAGHARPAALMRAACECRGAFALRLARKNDARSHATHATARSAESTRRGPGRPRRAARGLGRGPGLVVTHEATRTPRESDPLQPLPAAPPRGISSVLDHLHGNAHRGASRSRDALSIPHAPTAAAASSRRAGRPGVKSGSDVGTAAMVTHVVCERVRPVG